MSRAPSTPTRPATTGPQSSTPDTTGPQSFLASPAVHPASLVSLASHSPAILQLIEMKLTPPVIDYLVLFIAETVDCGIGRSLPFVQPKRANFTAFVTLVMSRAAVLQPTVLTTLVYLARARPHLFIQCEEWALERVFLGALIVACKYTNDSTLKNGHWALCTGIFKRKDVGRMEREFLDVLDWELSVSETDILAHREGLLATKQEH
ncbi:hypothetical protein C8R46DRAFT_891190 [Mycena filopes]|nr:hypothetical protein C8R46DRAFT_891190 [Mycena filopes]